MTNNTNPTSFTNKRGESWHDVADVVHPFMCPDTGMSCHSLCVCYTPNEKLEEYHKRNIPSHVGTCGKYDVTLYD